MPIMPIRMPISAARMIRYENCWYYDSEFSGLLIGYEKL